MAVEREGKVETYSFKYSEPVRKKDMALFSKLNKIPELAQGIWESREKFYDGVYILNEKISICKDTLVLEQELEGQKLQKYIKKYYLIGGITKINSSYVLQLSKKENKEYKLFSFGYDLQKKSIFCSQYEKENIYFQKVGNCK